jgi:hypothetical protein
MLFFLKKPKLHIDAFISETYTMAYETVPLKYSNHYYPEWWKKMPKAEFDFDTMEAKINMKRCLGLIKFYENSITLPMWSDFALSITNNGDWKSQFSDRMSVLTFHPKGQRVGFKDEYENFKLDSPWLLRTKKDINFFFGPDFYNFQQTNIEICPGVLDFYHSHSTNINFLTKRNNDVFIPFGQPLINIIPLSEDIMVLKNHLISEREYQKLKSRIVGATFVGMQQTINKYHKKNESKCPFGFGSK